MNSILYWLQWAAFRCLSLLPLSVLYLLGNILGFLLYRIFFYRVKTVRENLKKAFPEKETVWLKETEALFYGWFCDQLVETIKTLDLSIDDILKRVEIENPELLNDLHERGKHVIFVGAHHSNWEWLHKALTLHMRHLHLIIYKPLNNEPIDVVVREMREKYGAKAVPMKQIFKALEAHKATLNCTFVLGDQSPTAHNRFMWIPFMHQNTAVYTGAEELARKYNAAVVYGHMYRKSRGYYGVKLSMVTESPFELKPGELTQLHTARLETQLNHQPAFWLWSHRRWKLNPEQHPAYVFS